MPAEMVDKALRPTATVARSIFMSIDEGFSRASEKKRRQFYHRYS